MQNVFGWLLHPTIILDVYHNDFFYKLQKPKTPTSYDDESSEGESFTETEVVTVREADEEDEEGLEPLPEESSDSQEPSQAAGGASPKQPVWWQDDPEYQELLMR